MTWAACHLLNSEWYRKTNGSSWTPLQLWSLWRPWIIGRIDLLNTGRLDLLVYTWRWSGVSTWTGMITMLIGTIHSLKARRSWRGALERELIRLVLWIRYDDSLWSPLDWRFHRSWGDAQADPYGHHSMGWVCQRHLFKPTIPTRYGSAPKVWPRDAYSGVLFTGGLASSRGHL